MNGPPDEAQRVRRVLEEELVRIDSPAAAEAVVRRVERLAAGATEAAEGEAAARSSRPAAAAIEEAARAAPPREEAAAALVTTAAQAVAPTPEASEVVRGAQKALGTRPVQRPPAPEARRGRDLLRAAVLRRMGPLQALDARLFLAVNCLPHPRTLDAAAELVTVVTTGGGAWMLGVALAGLRGAPRSRRALVDLAPTVLATTWIVEYPVKAAFRRKRPFIHIVRALVVGKRPGSWSFPSGHTAAAFASAWVLSRHWPRRAPHFFALAGAVGFSRIYVGAHYPGDVSSGALAGLALSLVLQPVVRRLVR
ncbi:MAG TPA: phosphatase PAP2 family protein [Chloroflexota bacterium]|nr:phosphatase PAP2 family protein [Chloroflexota bacterium]